MLFIFFNLKTNNNESAANNYKTQENPDQEPDLCFKHSGLLGWVMCLIIQAASGIGEHMWHQIEEYHMKIPAQEVFKEGGGVQTAWDAIRGISNILFIILFLVIIFSQLTGVGIDNYGIKKMLPRLIIVAILVNVSYILCYRKLPTAIKSSKDTRPWCLQIKRWF